MFSISVAQARIQGVMLNIFLCIIPSFKNYPILRDLTNIIHITSILLIFLFLLLSLNFIWTSALASQMASSIHFCFSQKSFFIQQPAWSFENVDIMVLLTSLKPSNNYQVHLGSILKLLRWPKRPFESALGFCVFLKCAFHMLFQPPRINHPWTSLSPDNCSLNFKTESIYHFFGETCSNSLG